MSHRRVEGAGHDQGGAASRGGIFAAAPSSSDAFRQAVDLPRFTLASYMRDHAIGIAIAATCLAVLYLMLTAFGLTSDARALAVALVAAGVVLAHAVDYARRVRYWRELAFCLQTFDRPLLLPSLLDEPRFIEGRIAHEALVSLARQAAFENGVERDAARSHREYVELWVHEVKTPIAAARLILASMHGAQALKLRGEIERVEQLVEQALYMARSGSLSNDYSISRINLAQAAREACKRNAHFLIERGVAVNVCVSEELWVLADEPWLVFVLGQVVVNAAKYGAGTITFSAHEEQSGTPRGHTVLEVRDDGVGIPAQDVPRVFDRGFTGEVGRAYGSATGMGLYLVAVVCAAMGLGVQIGSEQGKGTRMMFAFPHDRRRLT